MWLRVEWGVISSYLAEKIPIFSQVVKRGKIINLIFPQTWLTLVVCTSSKLWNFLSLFISFPTFFRPQEVGKTLLGYKLVLSVKQETMGLTPPFMVLELSQSSDSHHLMSHRERGYNISKHLFKSIKGAKIDIIAIKWHSGSKFLISKTPISRFCHSLRGPMYIGLCTSSRTIRIYTPGLFLDFDHLDKIFGFDICVKTAYIFRCFFMIECTLKFEKYI